MRVRHWILTVGALLVALAPASAAKRCCLTFDDGPRADFLNQALDIFDRYQVKVTFFNVGQCIKANPKLTVEVARRGHAVENHSYTHPIMSKCSVARMTSEIEKTSALITQYAGKAPTYFRPPYGATNKTVKAVAEQHGMSQVLWSVDPLDWQGSATASRTASRVLNQLHKNAVILMHEVQPTLHALPAIIEGIRDRGYEIVLYSDLMALKQAEATPAKQIVIHCGDGQDDKAELAGGCGYALERGLRAVSPPGWTAERELRFKLMVPKAALGTLQLSLGTDPAKPQSLQRVTLNGNYLGSFPGGRTISAPVIDTETKDGVVVVEVLGDVGAHPTVELVSFDRAPS